MFCDAILLHFNSFNTWNINVMWLRERHFVITRSDRQQQDQNNASPLLQFILTSYSLKKGGTLFPVQKLNMRIWTPLPGFDDLNQWVGFLDLQWWHAVLRECQNYSLGKLKYQTLFPSCLIVKVTCNIQLCVFLPGKFIFQYKYITHSFWTDEFRWVSLLQHQICHPCSDTGKALGQCKWGGWRSEGIKQFNFLRKLVKVDRFNKNCEDKPNGWKKCWWISAGQRPEWRTCRMKRT
jgi:hypothetical protein